MVRCYRANNGVFSSAAFEEEIQKGSQRITYSGVGAQYQNGVAERAIQTVVERARNMLVHATIRLMRIMWMLHYGRVHSITVLFVEYVPKRK